jgi:hypothetical protein
MDAHPAGPAATLAEVRRIDAWAREHAEAGVRELQST